VYGLGLRISDRQPFVVVSANNMKDVTGASLQHEVHVGDEVMSIDAKTLCDSEDR
jgi:hypothetical protein